MDLWCASNGGQKEWGRGLGCEKCERVGFFFSKFHLKLNNVSLGEAKLMNFNGEGESVISPNHKTNVIFS